MYNLNINTLVWFLLLLSLIYTCVKKDIQEISIFTKKYVT